MLAAGGVPERAVGHEAARGRSPRERRLPAKLLQRGRKLAPADSTQVTASLAEGAEVQQGPDGSILRIAIQGRFQPPSSDAAEKVVKAFRVKHTEESIVLSPSPGSSIGRADYDAAGLPTNIGVQGPAVGRNDGSDGDKGVAVRLDWDGGRLAGVRVSGDIPTHVDPETERKIWQVFRVQHDAGRVLMSLDRAQVAGITRIENMDLGDGVVAKAYCPNIKTQRRAAQVLVKEPDTIAWLDRIPPEATLWDIGANIGVFTFYAAMKRGCRVLAFEPDMANCHVLNRNIEINGVQDRVTAYCLAVARTSGIDLLYQRGTDYGGANSNFGSATDALGEAFAPAFKQGMVGFSLDDLAERLPVPSHLKIDVDGLEQQILLGGERLLADPSVRSLLVEIELQGDLVRDIVGIMQASGFIHANAGQGPIEGKKVINAVFERAA